MNIKAIYHTLIEPRSTDEDSRRKEFILNVILVGSLVLLIIYDYFILINSARLGAHYKGIPFHIFTLIPLFFSVLLILSRKGYFIISSYAMIFAYLLGTIYGSYRWGADLPISILAFVLIILISSILIGTKYGYLLTFIISICSFILWYLQIEGIIEAQWYWKDEYDLSRVIEFAVMYLLIMVISWLSNREIEKSLFRARKSEQELRQERDSLEVKVEERTKDLKQAQLEKMSQLYRFAEFGRLSSGLFHDLMSPVTALSLNSNQLKHSSNTEEAEKTINKIIFLSRKLESFLCAIDRQIKEEEKESEFSINEQIEEILEILDYKSRKNSVELIFNAESVVTLFGDSQKFQQIILNILSFNIDAHRENKTLGEITVSFLKENSRICVNICGPKISGAQTEKSETSLHIAELIIKKNFNGKIESKINGNRSNFNLFFTSKSR